MSKKRAKCSRCGQHERTANGYCKACNSLRMAESRGKVPLPETKELQQVRVVVDRAFALLDAAPGTRITVGGVTLESSSGSDGSVSVTFDLTDEQYRKLVTLTWN